VSTRKRKKKKKSLNLFRKMSLLQEFYRGEDPLVLSFIKLNVPAEVAVEKHPPLAESINEIMRIISSEPPPEDFWATLFSWLVKRGFSKPVEMSKADLLKRFAVVLTYDAARFGANGGVPPQEDAKLAATLMSALNNLYPGGLNEILLRDLSDEDSTAEPGEEDWKKAIQEGWAFLEFPPDASVYKRIKNSFHAKTTLQYSGSLIERIRSQQQMNVKSTVTWTQVQVNLYARTSRQFLINALHAWSFRPNGLVNRQRACLDNAAKQKAKLKQPQPQAGDEEEELNEVNGAAIPKRALVEMFRMCTAADVHDEADLKFLGLKLSPSQGETINQAFVKKERPPPPAPAYFDKDYVSDLLIDARLEGGEVAAALLSDRRFLQKRQTQAIKMCEVWVNNKYFLRSWLTGNGVLHLAQAREMHVDQLKAYYLYHSTCHDGLSQLHAFLEPAKLTAWVNERGHHLSALDDLSSAAQKVCFVRKAQHALAVKGEQGLKLQQRWHEILMDAVGWHYLPRDVEPTYLSDERLARLFAVLHKGVGARLHRRAMWEMVWQTLDGAPREVFQTIAQARLIPEAFSDKEADFKAKIANTNYARVRFFQNKVPGCALLSLAEVEKALQIVAVRQPEPVREVPKPKFPNPIEDKKEREEREKPAADHAAVLMRGKNIMLQYSRMMEVYGGEQCREHLAMSGSESWDRVLKEYFQKQRFVAN